MSTDFSGWLRSTTDVIRIHTYLWVLSIVLRKTAPLSYCLISSLRKQLTFGDATTGFPTKWRPRNERRNSILMTRHFPDLGSASSWSCFVGNLIQPIRSTTQISVVMRHQHGISAFVSQTSFGGEASDSVAKCISAVFLSYLISTSLEVLSESQKLISLQSVLQMTFVKLHDWWFHVQVKNERTADTVRKLPAIIC